MRDYDIESDLKQEKFQSIKLVQGDRGNKIKINVYEDGQPVNLAGCSVTAKYKRADGEIINDGVIENIHDNSFDAVMDSSITKVAGTLKMLFTIEKDDVKVSTFLLLADVRESIGENTGSSGGNTGGGSGEVTIDLSNYYKKIETYSKNQIDARFKDIVKQIENVGNPTDEQVATAINQAIKDGKISVGGWSSTAVTLFESLMGTLAFTDIDTGKALVASLCTELRKSPGGGSTGGDTPSEQEKYTITYSLDTATSTNTATEIEKDSSYTTTLSNPSDGYISNVTVIMGGNNITDTVYTSDTKTINITKVTGNIIITVIVSSYDNLVDFNTCTDGEKMPNGAIITAGVYLITDYIEVTPSTPYYTNITRYIDESNTDWGQGVYCYKQDKSYINFAQEVTNSPFNTIHKFSTTDETCFIRIKFHVNYKDIIYFGKSGVTK